MPLSGSSLQPTTPEEWRAYLAAYEVPETCGCPIERRPVCVTHWRPEGCLERQEAGECDCPLTMGCPCRHILAKATWVYRGEPDAVQRKCARILQWWARALLQMMPEEYAEPPPDPSAEAKKCLTRELRVQRMRLRVKAGYSPWSPADLERTDAVLDDVGTQAQGRHGHRTETGVTTYAPNHVLPMLEERT